MKKLKINTNDYDAIMLSALNSFRRESWLTEAVDLEESGLAENVTEVIEGMFSPFCDRLIEASTLNDVTEGNARSGFFCKFTEMAV
ncbi:unnamed protein product [marine sediment metagenome]|uniref:Uncharacterized protein n=1 Tax=marine sediment metagenome TaxID=412755 RepID=X1CD80_9ZZZZ